jgi:hypothetical protein
MSHFFRLSYSHSSFVFVVEKWVNDRPLIVRRKTITVFFSFSDAQLDSGAPLPSVGVGKGRQWHIYSRLYKQKLA